MSERVVEIRRPRPCPADCSCHNLYRAGFNIVSDLVDAWHAVVARPDVDVGPPAEHHIAGARLGRAMCVRLGSMLGHRIPAGLVSCAVSVTVEGDQFPRFEADDHVVLVTDRAIVDLGLAARCKPALTIHPRIVIERLDPWPAPELTLRLRGHGVTVLYRPEDHSSYRRSELWRRSYCEWEPVLAQLDAACMNLLRDRGPYFARSESPVGGNRR